MKTGYNRYEMGVPWGRISAVEEAIKTNGQSILDLGNRLNGEIGNLVRRVEGLEFGLANKELCIEKDQLREVLLKHGGHIEGCSAKPEDGIACNCRWDKILAQLLSSTETTP